MLVAFISWFTSSKKEIGSVLHHTSDMGKGDVAEFLTEARALACSQAPKRAERYMITVDHVESYIKCCYGKVKKKTVDSKKKSC